MFVILLKFSTQRTQASEWMGAHKAWLEKGFEDGVFVASGSLQDQQGGCILAVAPDRASLDDRVAQDPFVIHDIVVPEVIDVSVSKVDDRLHFLI